MEDKKRKRGGSDHRKRIWSWMFGTDKKAPCPLCGECEIFCGENTTSPFEAAHIVAYMYSKDDEAERTLGDHVFHMIPCCKTCNDATGTQCIWDFLFFASRMHLLRIVAWRWFQAYKNNLPATVEAAQGILWKLVDNLFGQSRYPNGGGIVYREEIYRALYMLQLQKLQERYIKLTNEMSETCRESDVVAKSLRFI